MNILLLISSPRGPSSYSTRVARSLAERILASHPGAALVVRDLTNPPLPHIGADFIVGMGTPAENRTAAQRDALAVSDDLVGELLAADVLIIGSAMINFGLASTLKGWFDYVMRAGATFRYTEQGAEGLVKGKKAYIVQARGGVYADGPMRTANFQEPYLKQLLAFMGITDVEAVVLEGIAFGPEVADKALAAALTEVSRVRSWSVAN